MGFIGAFTPLVEILLIAIILNYLLSLFWYTKSRDLLIGGLSFLTIFAITSLLHLPILYTIMTNLANVAVIAILVIFQPEFRVALSKLSLKGKRYREVTEFDKFLDQLTNSVYNLAGKRIGALIALEYEDKLDEFAQKAVMLNAQFSSELLETIFATSTPLHDGCVIIRDMTIVAAAVILPLAEDSYGMTKSMGTRRRAALGISQVTDSVVIVVSEENGKVSIVHEGSSTPFDQGIKTDRFKSIIRSIFKPAQQIAHAKAKFSLRKLLGA